MHSVYVVYAILTTTIMVSDWIGKTTAQPRLCSKPAEYSACTTTAGLAIAACNGKVVSVPDLVYYQCLCTGNQQLQQCYTVCPDDPQLQLQATIQNQSVFSTCKASQDMEAAASSASVAISSTSLHPTSTLVALTTSTLLSVMTTSSIRTGTLMPSPEPLTSAQHTLVVVGARTNASPMPTTSGIGTLPPSWALSGSPTQSMWRPMNYILLAWIFRFIMMNEMG
ncbi:hypothetical protein QVD99_000864 [Batrachochytrium dendrobatidis]|nr:hypothetical protein O5D80_003715 [Batrachochytrium dendrobatidis]KAK5673416.1 hypothetical protein QVD99_000864 [Batrachochytrium dendrobatidis]